MPSGADVAGEKGLMLLELVSGDHLKMKKDLSCFQSDLFSCNK